MKPLVILCRHGNTFEKGEKVVMVGAGEDLPLTTHGIEQGKRVAKALVAADVTPTRIISGPLKRTKVFADQIVAETKAQVGVEIDSRLVEFDYGAWSGLSNDEIIALSGEDALNQWQEQSIRPDDVTFSPSEERARQDAQGLLHELESGSGCCVVVTSNGRLREFGRILTNSFAPQSFKVKTGHACVLLRENEGWRVLGWDVSSEELEPIFIRQLHR